MLSGSRRQSGSKDQWQTQVWVAAKHPPKHSNVVNVGNGEMVNDALIGLAYLIANRGNE
jgi:hypothetical protein